MRWLRHSDELPQMIAITSGQRKLTLALIQPGKPTQNAFIESFNGKFRDGCLNQYWRSVRSAAIRGGVHFVLVGLLHRCGESTRRSPSACKALAERPKESILFVSTLSAAVAANRLDVEATAPTVGSRRWDSAVFAIIFLAPSTQVN